MKRIKFLTVLGLGCICFGVSCNLGAKKSNDEVKKVEYEMEKLTNVAELDAIATRGDDNIVDWQLSREFAELWLENGIADGEYPADSVLWEIPIAIYSSEGNIKFYEFRIISKGKTIGAIVGAATKDYGCPVVYEGLKDGYADEITELYNSGKLTQDQLPRIVDDGYPRVVAGVISEARGTADGFSGYLDLKTGDSVEKGDVQEVIDYSEVKQSYPELLSQVSEDDDKKILEAIKDYEDNGKAFWEMAVANKGNIANFAVRGTAKNKPLTLKDGMKKYWEWRGVSAIHGIVNYGACGPVAEGFVLDYLHANDLIGKNNNWSGLLDEAKKDILYKKLSVFAVFGNKDIGEATWPHNIGNAVSYYSNYKVKLSWCICPEDSIDKGLPGINLRTFRSGFAHYRPVIAYKKPGWWIFKWWEFKILDLYDCPEKKRGPVGGNYDEVGRWETYVPVSDFATFNVLKK